MLTVKKSKSFHIRAAMFTRNYRKHANEEVALDFVAEISKAIRFIIENPYGCAIDVGAQEHEILKQYEIRKWKLHKFPHSIFFRIDKDVLTLETIHAHRMIKEQFYTDIADKS